MLNFGLAIGALLFAAGVITYVLAPRVGPNPIFGVRVGYSYASREVWDQSNRFGGVLIAAIGLATAALALLLDVLGIPQQTANMWLTAALVLGIVVSAIWMFIYARGLAQGTAIAQQTAPVQFRWAYLAPVLVSFGLLFAVVLLTYPMLPADRIATHFDMNYRPDGWSSRDNFVPTYLGLAALYVLIDIAIVLVATREPLIAFGRWGAKWLIEPARGLIYSGLAFSLVNLILVAVYLDVFWFNTRGVHLFPLNMLFGATVALIAVLVALFFMLGRRVAPR